MLRTLAAPAAVLLLAACVYTTGQANLAAAEPVDGAGDLQGVTRLDTSAGLNVIYTVSDTYSIDVEVRRGDRSDVRIEREGSTLEIGRVRRNGGWNWGNNLDATVTVSGPKLEAIDSSSGSSVQVSGISAVGFLIDVSSGASVEASGSCERLSVDAYSGGSASAVGLICTDGSLEASSGGSVEVYLTGIANVDVSSGGSVDIDGGASLGRAEKSSGGSYSLTPAPL